MMSIANQTQRRDLDRLNAILKTKRGKIMAALDRIEDRVLSLLSDSEANNDPD